MPSLVSYRMCKDGESDLTSSQARIIELTEQLRAQSSGKKYECCHKCKVKFTKGDVEIVRRGMGIRTTKWYHVDCAKLVNII